MTGRRLDDVLAPRGFHVIHDCACPGTSAKIDHLVLGATGAWVIHDVADASKHALAVAAKEATAQADAVAGSLGTPTRAIVAVPPDAETTEGTTRTGVVIAHGANAIDVIANAPATLRPGEVDRLADRARRGLKGATDKSKSTKKKRSRWPVLVAVVTIAVAAGALFLVTRDEPAAETTGDASPISITYECRNATRGWTQLVTWTGLDGVHTVEWAPAIEGPWTTAVLYGVTGIREGVPASETGIVRVGHGGGMEASTTATAPATGC